MLIRDEELNVRFAPQDFDLKGRWETVQTGDPLRRAGEWLLKHTPANFTVDNWKRRVAGDFEGKHKRGCNLCTSLVSDLLSLPFSFNGGFDSIEQLNTALSELKLNPWRN
jgi:hypothetical protein